MRQTKANLISPSLNSLEFLKTLTEMDREEIIHSASLERNTAKDVTVKRGDKVTSRKLTDYSSNRVDFLYFVNYEDDSEMSWPEAYLASPEWQHKQHARTFAL